MPSERVSAAFAESAKVRPTRVSDVVARELRERILRNEFPDNVLPKQEDLVKDFGVSAPSLREAFRVLETEGLIKVRRGNVGGAVVRVPDQTAPARAIGLALQSDSVPLADVSEALCQFDATAAGLCARRSDRATAVVPKLRALVDDSSAVVDDPKLWRQSAIEFHYAIAAACGNSTMRVIISSLYAVWEPQQEEWLRLNGDEDYYSGDDRLMFIDEHRRLVELIADGNVPGVTHASVEHLSRSHRHLLEQPELTVSVTGLR